MAVTVRLFAAAREAAGSDTVHVPAGPVHDVCAALERSARQPTRLAQVLAVSTLLVDGVRYRAADRALLAEGSVVDVLPPFAGG